MESTGTAISPLLATLADLWPDAEGIELSRTRGPSAVRTLFRAGGRGGPRTQETEFLVVPNSRAPRMLIPTLPASAAAGSLRRYSAAISWRETAQRLGLAAGLQLGAGPALLPERITVRGRARAPEPGAVDIAAYLGNVLGQSVRVSLTIGPARANRKPVLQVFDRRGRALAFVKVGDSPTAAGHVAREGESLRVLGEEHFSTLAIPSLLSLDSWRGMLVLVMSALPTGPFSRNPGFDVLRAKGLSELAEAFAAGPQALGETPMWKALRADQDQLRQASHRSRFSACLERAEQQFGDRVVDVGAWHGDCSPWNMAYRRGRLQLWDWERFERGVPLGMDAIHYAVNKQLRDSPTNAENVLAGLRAAAPALDDPASPDALLAVAYLCSITLRYLLGTEGPGGEVLADRTEVMLGVLDHLTSRLDGVLHV